MSAPVQTYHGVQNATLALTGETALHVEAGWFCPSELFDGELIAAVDSLMEWLYVQFPDGPPTCGA